MAAKAAKNTKQQRRTGSEKHKVQAGMAVEKRAKGVKGRNVKARLEQLTAELDMRTAEVQNAYMTVRNGALFVGG